MADRKITKVLLISPISGVVGGIMRWTNHIARHYSSIPENNRQVELCLCDFSRRIPGQLVQSIIKKSFYASSEYLKLICAACHTISETDPDIVHITSPGSFLSIKDYILVRYAKKKNCKTIIHYRFGRIPNLFNGNSIELRLLRKVMNIVDQIVVIDQRSYDTLMNAGYKKLKLLPNPLSDDVFRLEMKYRLEERIPRTVLFAGHVIPTKGVKELIEACKEIKNINLLILGTVSEVFKTELYTLAGPDSQTWLNIKGEADYETTIREMCSCSVFALPTYTEGFPNVVLEAMACGTPIVTCPVGAIPEMLDCGENSQCGIIVPAKNFTELRKGIEKMLNDKEFASLCAKKAQAKVRENYTMGKVWDSLSNIWKQ